MTRKEFTPRTKRLALYRSGGFCEAEGIKFGLRAGVRCNASLADHKPEYDHLKECYLEPDNSLENVRVICRECHKRKTAIGAKERAKIKRLQNGGERKSQRQKRKTIWPKGKKIPSRPFNTKGKTL